MKIRILTAFIAAFFMLAVLGGAAYAAGDDPPNTIITEELIMPGTTPAIVEPPPAPTTAPPPPPAERPNTAHPLTPSGAGTVIDYAADSDEKVFYTITTPDKHVFYLVIDKQRGAENVYFLNAVTVDDLMALAEMPQNPPSGTVSVPSPVDAPETPEPAPIVQEPEQKKSNAGAIIFIALIIILGGGAGWYLKIYRPKQRGTASGEEYEPPDVDENDYGDWDDDHDDTAPWNIDEESEDGQ
jgi:hypothetical protein